MKVDVKKEELESRLLKLGGEKVAFQHGIDLHLGIMLERGRLFDADSVKMIRGARLRCHPNSLLRYLQFCNEQTAHQSCEVVVGFALLGGLWLQHTWLWADQRIIETTIRRSAYFGGILTPAESVKFVMSEIVFCMPGFDDCSSQMRESQN